MSLFQEIVWAFNNGRVGIIVGFSIIGFATLSLALFFFLMRESIVWYFRIHELIALQRKTNDLLQTLVADRAIANGTATRTVRKTDNPEWIALHDAPHLRAFKRLEEADAEKIAPLDTI